MFDRRSLSLLARGSFLAALLLAGSACESTPPGPSPRERCFEPQARQGEVVARVGRVALTVGDLVQAARAGGGAAQRRLIEPDELKQFVEDQVRVELLSQAAIDRGLDRDPEVVSAARKVMVRRLLERDLASVLTEDERLAVSDEAVARAYGRDRDRYVLPELRRVAHVQLPATEQAKALASTLIGQLASAPTDAALWNELVARYSVAPGAAERGGELAYQSELELTEDFGPGFAAKAFGLAPGAVSPEPVQSARGWHVLRLVGVRPAVARSLDEVRDEIRSRLMRELRSTAFERYLGELRARFPVEMHPEQVSALGAALAERAPPSSVP